MKYLEFVEEVKKMAPLKSVFASRIGESSAVYLEWEVSLLTVSSFFMICLNVQQRRI